MPVSASFVAKISVFLGGLTALLTYIIGALSAPFNGSGLNWWPIQTISVYGATIPAAWLFRIGMITAGAGMVLFSVIIRQAEWFKHSYLLLLVAGLFLMITGSISCEENNNIHSGFAVLFFLVCAIWFLIFGCSLSSTTSSRNLKYHATVGGTFLLVELCFLILVFTDVIPLDRDIALPLLEWPGVFCILSILFHLARYLERHGVELRKEGETIH